MARLNRSQLQSQLRRAAERQRQAVRDYNRSIDKFNSALREYNAGRRRAIEDHNRRVRAYNSAVRTNRDRLRREISRLQSSPSSSTRYVTFHSSVVNLRQRFSDIERSADSGRWLIGAEIFDLVEGETANSVAVLNAITGSSGDPNLATIGALQTSTLDGELSALSADLAQRWKGALYALSPQNPDAARHFCTSARELLTAIVDLAAPEALVPVDDPSISRTSDGRVTRRSRLHYRLEQKGISDPDLETFVEADIDDVVSLFREFNDGTHGTAGHFSFPELSSIKHRVEDAVRFLHHLIG